MPCDINGLLVSFFAAQNHPVANHLFSPVRFPSTAGALFMQDALTTFTLPSGEIKALYIQREGPLLVMIHGFPGRPQDFKRLIEALDSFSILAIALPFGVSPSPFQLSF